MDIDWQNAVTLALVAVAAIYVIWRARRAAGRGKPPTCGMCPDSTDRPDRCGRELLITIDPPPKR